MSSPPRFAQPRRIRRALRLYGLREALRRAGRALHSRALSHRAGDDPGRAFDERFGVDTVGIVRLERLALRGPNRDLGQRYQASDPTEFRKTICSLEIRFEDFVFIDYGSGKGRALLLASEFPFKRIVGIEFSEILHEIARANIAAYSAPSQRCASIESLWMDAAEYDLPQDPLVLYFYNPFLEPLMQDVVDRVHKRQSRSECAPSTPCWRATGRWLRSC